MLGSVLNFLTRSTLSISAPTLKTSLHIDDEHFAYIIIVFQLALMLQPFSGYILDVLGLKRGFALFAGAWSITNMAHAFARTWPQFAVLRGLLGLSEGSANPAGMKTVATWFPAKERGFAGGIFNLGASAGSLLAAPLVAWAILYFDWQAAFVITGGLGLIWVVAWLFFYESPARHPSLTSDERDLIAAGQEAHLAGDGKRPSILSIISQRNFWGIALPRFLADPTWGTLTNWMALYLTDIRHFDLKHIALFAWLPFLAADLGCLFGAVFGRWIQRYARLSLIDSRRCAFTLGALMMTGVAFVSVVPNPYVAILLLSLGGFAHQTLSVTVITMASDLFKRNEVGTVAGLAGTMGNGGLLIFTYFIGKHVDKSGYGIFFVILPVLDVLGAVILWTLVRQNLSMPKEQPAKLPA
jgi:ACS family hexuronate transporter-like MFS transporter